MVTNRRQDRVFAALADPTRRRIVQTLAGGSRPVHRIAADFRISRPAISRHLRILCDAGVVERQAAGRSNLYTLRSPALQAVEEWLTGIWSTSLGKLKTMVEEGVDA